MITYLYWFAVIAVSLVSFWGLGRVYRWKAGAILGLLIFLVGWGAYYFNYQQLFVKNYGGIMSIEVPEGQVHILATWKDNHLWIENYDPKTNTCHFNEYSMRHVLEGEVVIKNCNPILPSKLDK